MTTLNIEFEPRKYKPMKRNMPLSLDGIKLNPGINRDVDSLITKHPFWQHLLDKKAVTVMTDADLPAAPAKSKKITLMTIEEAKELIKRTLDLTTLQVWYEEDGRKGVKELISRQIQFIESGK